MYTINIGLANPFTGGYNSVDNTLKEALKVVAGIVAIRISTACEEPTVIIQYTHHKGKIKLLATALDQDCIAWFDHSVNVGVLIGDKAEAWGDFNLEYFQHINAKEIA